MPTSLPVATLFRARQRRSGANPVILSCVALGAAGIALAFFVACVCGDLTGGFLTLVTVSAAIFLLLLRALGRGICEVDTDASWR